MSTDQIDFKDTRKIILKLSIYIKVNNDLPPDNSLKWEQIGIKVQANHESSLKFKVKVK